MQTNVCAARALLPILLAGVFLIGIGCERTKDGDQRRAEPPVAAAKSAATPSAPRQRGEEAERAGEPEHESEEEKETAEETRMRQRAVDAMGTYRASSCREAVAKIEDLLRRGKGRWEERDARGAIPGDLVQILTQADLWAGQSELVCKDAAEKPRFDSLRSVIVAIWHYPRAVSREALDERLRILDQ